MVEARELIAGSGEGPLKRLRAPISFWGGIDPIRGVVSDPRHPDFESSIVGTVLYVPAAVGSSSSSAIMLELLREETAPAAIVMGEADAILALGVIVGSELGYAPVPVIEAGAAALEGVPDGARIRIENGSIVRLDDGTPT